MSILSNSSKNIIHQLYKHLSIGSENIKNDYVLERHDLNEYNKNFFTFLKVTYISDVDKKMFYSVHDIRMFIVKKIPKYFKNIYLSIYNEKSESYRFKNYIQYDDSIGDKLSAINNDVISYFNIPKTYSDKIINSNIEVNMNDNKQIKPDSLVYSLLRNIINNFEIHHSFAEHGTFASGLVKTVSDIDVTNYFNITNIVKNKKNNNNTKNNNNNKNEIKQKIVNHIQNVVKTLPSNIIFHKLSLCGIDERFRFEKEVKINGEIIGYDYEKYKTKLDKLYKNGVLTKDEYGGLIGKLKKDANLDEMILFYEKVDKFFYINWSKKDILNGYIILRGDVKMNLDDALVMEEDDNNANSLKLLLEYQNGKYIQIDCSYTFYKKDKGIYKFINNKSRTKGSQWTYYDIFKEKTKGRYLKTMKRLRTLLADYVFNENKTIKASQSQKGHLKKIRRDMRIIYETRPSKLNVYRKNFDIAIILIETKERSELEIKKYLIDVIRIGTIEYQYGDKLKTLVEKVEKYKFNSKKSEDELINEINNVIKILYDEINELIKPELKQILSKLDYILPFKLDI